MATAVCTLCAFFILCIMTTRFSTQSATACAEVPEVTMIAKFSTYYGDSSDNRKHNIALAAKFIDGTVILPEDKSAYIISDGTFVEGTGGGVCQVSSTLYNCALLADMTITCVRPHSLPVSYVAPSFDAMVSSASDLRFANTLAAPVTVRMTADGKYLRAEIYGVSSGVNIRRRSETVGTIPQKTEYVDDTSLTPGEEKIDTYGRDGLKSEGYLEYFSNGTLLKTIRIRKDTYLPQTRIILRGVATETPPPDENAPQL